MIQLLGMGLGMAGSAMQFMGQRKTARATERVAGKMRRAGESNASENFGISDNLRKALESITDRRTSELGDYFERRISPDRVTEAGMARDARDEAAGGGLQRALSALQPPEGAYVPNSAPFQQSLEGFEQRREMPSLEALLDQISAQGYLTGGQDYDTQNQQQMALNVRPYDNEAELRNLMTGVRQAETTSDFNGLMTKLNRDMEKAQQAGAKQAMIGSLMQMAGTAMSGGMGGMGAGIPGLGGGGAPPATPGYVPGEAL